MHTYLFSWNGRRKFINADNVDDADAEFMRKFGFDAFSTEGMQVSVNYAFDAPNDWQEIF